ncbi:hypothetical protein L6164_022864 [Bauhinia variegata]|uniref:Uncharacterized protein n=1 Tax=Bauhinia variegata TaxID=167791 RepID=A0ACB9MGZ6_BAUVA|nr:hypothetical protein L6164_022864 [Bauhinia variegata]
MNVETQSCIRSCLVAIRFCIKQINLMVSNAHHAPLRTASTAIRACLDLPITLSTKRVSSSVLMARTELKLKPVHAFPWNMPPRLPPPPTPSTFLEEIFDIDSETEGAIPKVLGSPYYQDRLPPEQRELSDVENNPEDEHYPDEPLTKKEIYPDEENPVIDIIKINH